ncbi:MULTISPECIES: hypothetical protein [unclassified Nostoc]|uniref:hypothetical protein n=1 Tax=unclassified Nostoc TaxID=2593658 RepID=UPI0025FD488D|nr:hypothetical protein [Nostoc sp. JL23]
MILDENKDYSVDRRRVGRSNATSESYGIERQGRINSSDIEKTDTFGTDVEPGDTSPGKLLGRLELLEKAFYGYVHGHQERLKTRFKESTELEAVFTEELQLIKQGLRDLAHQVEDDPE